MPPEVPATPAPVPAAAPAAPTPAPAPPSAPTKPPEGGKLSPVKEAINAQRTALAAALSGAAPAADPTPQPPAPPAAEEAPPAAEEAPPPAEAPPAEEAPSEEAPPAEEVDPRLVVKLPPRNEGEEPLEVEVPDPETGDRLRQMVNGYQRSERVKAERAQLDAERAELREVEDVIATDPSGFILQRIPQERAEVVAMHLITQPGIWESVAPALKMMVEDESKLELARAKLEVERRDGAKAAQEQTKARREADRQARAVKDGVVSLIPADFTESQASEFYSAALTEVQQFAIRTGAETLDPRDLPVLIAGTLRQFGLDPVAVATHLASKGSAPAPTAPARPKVGVVARGGPPAPVKTGQQFVAGQRKAQTLGTPPGAAPSTPAEADLPPQQSVKDRIKFLRANRGR